MSAHPRNTRRARLRSRGLSAQAQRELAVRTTIWPGSVPACSGGHRSRRVSGALRHSTKAEELVARRVCVPPESTAGTLCSLAATVRRRPEPAWFCSISWVRWINFQCSTSAWMYSFTLCRCGSITGINLPKEALNSQEPNPAGSSDSHSAVTQPSTSGGPFQMSLTASSRRRDCSSVVASSCC